MLDVAGCRYWYSDRALSRADVYRRLSSPVKSTMISALPCPENTSVMDALGIRLGCAYLRSIEYLPAPVTHNSSRPPMMLMFL
jgi:hypothetical protein